MSPNDFSAADHPTPSGNHPGNHCHNRVAFRSGLRCRFFLTHSSAYQTWTGCCARYSSTQRNFHCKSSTTRSPHPACLRMWQLRPIPRRWLFPPVPRPTPNPGNTEWVRQRLDAVIALYQPTPAGVALLHSLDVRQMRGEPGFFGSYGFESWAGVGEAKPNTADARTGPFLLGGVPNHRQARPGVAAT